MDMERRVRSYVCSVVDCVPDRVTAVNRFESGERHAVYQVSYLDDLGDREDLVVRISTRVDGRDWVQSDREAAVLRKVEGFAAPRLYDYRRGSPWFDAPIMCMQFVAGRHGELAAAGPEDVERLGSLVARLHGLPVDDLVEWFPEPATAAAYVDRWLETIAGKLPSVRDPLPAEMQARLERALRLVNGRLESGRSGDASDNEEALVLLHGDIAGENIIWASSPILIDWEYARLGDRADEIAYLFSQNGLSAAQRAAFWCGYRDAAGPSREVDGVVDRVAWWEPVTLLGSVLWWIERWSDRLDADTAGVADRSVPKPQGYYLHHATRRLDRFDALVDRHVTPSAGSAAG